LWICIFIIVLYHFFQCIGISFLESFGLCLFALKILKIEKCAVVALLMDCVFLGHIFVTVIGYCRRTNEVDPKRKISFGISAITVVGGFGLTVFVIYSKFNDSKSISTSDLWHVFVAIACLSISWLPWLRKKTILVIQRYDRPEAEVVDISQYTQSQNTKKMSSVVPGVSSVANSDSSDNDDDADDFIDSSEKYTHKLMIISSFTKIISIVISSFILQDVIGGSTSQTINQISDGWRLNLQMETNPGRQTYYFIFNISTSFIGYFIGLYALRTQMSVGSFAIPLLLATPVTFLMLYVPDVCQSIFFVNAATPYSKTICYNTFSDLEFLLPALVLLWIAQVLSTGIYAIRTSTFVLQKEVKVGKICKVYDKVMHVLDGTPKGRDPTKIYESIFCKLIYLKTIVLEKYVYTLDGTPKGCNPTKIYEYTRWYSKGSYSYKNI